MTGIFSFVSAELDLVARDQDFVICQGRDPLTTPGGHEFAHPRERFLKFLLTDMVSGRYKEPCSAVNLFIFQKDVIEADIDGDTGAPDTLLQEDLFLAVKTRRNPAHRASGLTPSDPENMDQSRTNFRLWIFSSVLNRIQEFVSDHLHGQEIEESGPHPFEQLIRKVYQTSDPPRKAVVSMLAARHRSGLVLPMLLVYGRITPSEYGLALETISPVQADRTVTDAVSGKDYIMIGESQPGMVRLRQMIRSGESDSLEFKSTLRWDLKAGKTNQAVERASLKTISAFLNSRGGTLLIGVRDDGSVEGIGSDRFPNEDKFLLHLWTLIRTSFGRDVSPYIQTMLEEVDRQTVCAVSCRPSGRPVFLRQPGFSEEFYIRLGPASVALDVSEALKYIHERFPEFRV